MSTARFFIARHGETVFNAAGRMQGEAAHTPLTRAGFGQADEMGRVLREHLGARPKLALWSSPTGRALQTLAIVAEHLELDWHRARTDPRLSEIGMGSWGGRLYRDIEAEVGEFVDGAAGLFTRRAPGGEWYDEIAVRLGSWLVEFEREPGDRLIIMHGISSRVLRGMLTGAPQRPECRAAVADPLPQGSVSCIEGGIETVLHLADGGFGVSRPLA
ncbi:MAG: phosphoglycerate mutase family protein [Pseudomonadota bacterium]|nr:phosphoglycerate mutase family protein [Pseudomonadota bacterium]